MINRGNIRESNLSDGALAKLNAYEQPIFIEEANNGTILLERAAFAMTIESIDARCESGTCDVSVCVNVAPITGIDGVSVNQTFQTATATGGNSVEVGDTVCLTIANSSASGLFIQVRGTLA